MAIAEQIPLDEQQHPSNESSSIDIGENETAVNSRAQSNYSIRRVKNIIAPGKYGETRAQYLWRLLRCSIRRTIDVVAKADESDIERSHGVHFLRNINHEIYVKWSTYNISRKEIISIDAQLPPVARIYHSDGRFIRSKKLEINFDYMIYCVNEDEFIAWTKWKREIHVIAADLEILSTSTCDYDIGDLGYNEKTSEVSSCGKGGVTIWQFRYNRKHLLPKTHCHEGFKTDLQFDIIAIEQSNAAVQRIFVTSGYDILVFNGAFDGRLYSSKSDLHVRPIVAMIFVESRDVLVTAGRDGSIKVWDNRWFIIHAYVGHHDRILSLAKHPFGTHVLSSSNDKTIRVWSLEYGDVVDVVNVQEPIVHMNTAQNYEKFIVMSTKCLQLWCIKHYCDFLTFIGSPVLKISRTTHPDYPCRSVLLCKDSIVRILSCSNGNVLTSCLCDMHFKPPLISCAYAIAENILFATNGNILIKVNTALNPSKLIDRFQIPEQYSINCLIIYEYVAKSTMDETPMLKSLVTKPSKDLTHLSLKGFSRTLLVAGLSNGFIAVMNWSTGEIDFSLDMHSSRPVVDLISHMDADQIISCGADLIIRIWRVFPYAIESLSVVRTIFCALPPIHLSIVRNCLAVAFREDSTLTHSLMIYNLDNNGVKRFDHAPDSDHGDMITAVTGCSKLKLIATGSLDGTVRIWNGKNQLLRMVIIHDTINSLQFSNELGDLLCDLPKAILFKTVGMEFKQQTDEAVINYDQTQIERMPSADIIRLKRAHKSKEISIIVPNDYDLATTYTKSVEEMKQKNQELEKLEKRDQEINQIADGKLLRTKKYKISSKIRQRAFNEYMKMYLKEPHTIVQPEVYLPEQDNGFFPSLKEAQQDPISIMYKNHETKLQEIQAHYNVETIDQNRILTDIRQSPYLKRSLDEKYEIKKLLNQNLEHITLPENRPKYGPGAFVPNSVLAKLLWPNRELIRRENDLEWLPPVLSDEQLHLLEKNQVTNLIKKTQEAMKLEPVDEDEEWRALIEATMKKKLVEAGDEDDISEILEKKQKKSSHEPQSEFSKQLKEALKPAETPPLAVDVPVDVKEDEQSHPQRSARKTPQRLPIIKTVTPLKIRKKSREYQPTTPAVHVETPAEIREPTPRTPRVFAPPFTHLFEKLMELNWFDEQYPLVQPNVFLENCDENTFPIDVLQRIDFVQPEEHRFIILHELEHLFQNYPFSQHIRESIVEKILGHLMKYNPMNFAKDDVECIISYIRMLTAMNVMNIDVVTEWMYWYLDGGEKIRAIIKESFQQCGLDDSFGHFYNEMASWKLWELDADKSRRLGIKTLCYEWLRQWTRAFRTHLEEMHLRLKNGDIHVKISNATSRAINGDVSLTNRAASGKRNITVTINTLPRLNLTNLSAIEIINYFVEVTQEQINDRNQPQQKPDNNTILVLPKVIKKAALVRLGESNTDFHRPTKRNPIFLPHEHRYEPGQLEMGRYMNYPVKKLHLNPFRRQLIPAEEEEDDDDIYNDSVLLTLKLAPKFFLPILSQIAK
ncbi:unnamed protein product [Didymodactylos carnosus]|uniref:Uncharacterized protein n=1 Tax=Didymodactylos carnosus TaxID=1234261 RepID=A0A813SCA4_9BILA|nr:unnamed protein product [Didymodactylos carnosus]CAF0793161.1 unnamed protein product [Didymodactylos carnosus]CAF3501478.1 unnamed protein product [Didymodactylos carnosus]CAF3577544.1 unnamed protein product [Didymodactylos carnosus]